MAGRERSISDAKYRAAHREQKHVIDAAYRAAHRPERRAYSLAYNESHPGVMAAAYTLYRAKRRLRDYGLTD